jgi:cathepsin B
MYNKQSKTYADELAAIATFVNSRSNVSWKAHENMKWTGWNKEQAKRLQGMLVREKTDDFPLLEYTEEQALKAPASFDSRTQWPNCKSITMIRDQSACGSCWAFGAAEAMSDRICIHSGQTDQTIISSEDLMECCYMCGQGCNGGSVQGPWEYFKNTGLVSGGLYGDHSTCKPYAFPPCAHHTTSTKYPACPTSDYHTPSCKRKCQDGYPKSYNDDKKFAATAYAVRGAASMVSDISTNGPIEAGFTVYEDFLTYQTGVYHHVTGSALGGHAIKILGYGTDSGVDYWLCANSWNETWGDNGYFKIKRGTNECGIEGTNYAGIPK